VEPGEARTADIGSDAALRKLTGLKVGERVKLKCRQASDGGMIVEEAKKAKKGWPWWASVLITVTLVGAVSLWLMFTAGQSGS
jgi:hypothetical protein